MITRTVLAVKCNELGENHSSIEIGQVLMLKHPVDIYPGVYHRAEAYLPLFSDYIIVPINQGTAHLGGKKWELIYDENKEYIKSVIFSNTLGEGFSMRPGYEYDIIHVSDLDLTFTIDVNGAEKQFTPEIFHDVISFRTNKNQIISYDNYRKTRA